jgi:hypothetical protein
VNQLTRFVGEDFGRLRELRFFDQAGGRSQEDKDRETSQRGSEAWNREFPWERGCVARSGHHLGRRSFTRGESGG